MVESDGDQSFFHRMESEKRGQGGRVCIGELERVLEDITERVLVVGRENLVSLPIAKF